MPSRGPGPKKTSKTDAPSPGSTRERAASTRRDVRPTAAPTFLDLFAGCGGLSRGFTDAGFQLAGAVDNDASAAATFAANFGEEIVSCESIKKFDRAPVVDVVVGGPPCQGFSNLGKRDPTDTRNGLWREYARVVEASGCSVFVLENVPRFEDSRELNRLRGATKSGRPLEGFQIEVFRMNAADFGAPQRRIRTVVVGSRIGPIGHPPATHERLGAVLPAWRSVRDAISGFPREPECDVLPNSRIAFFGREFPGSFKQDELHVARSYTALSRERFRHIPAGGNRLDLPDRLKAPCWLGHESGALDVMGRLWWDRPAVTIRTEFWKAEKGRYLHPEVDRALTHAEAAALQGFDDRHLWCGTRVEIARQIGNAVPPPLAEAIARQLRVRFLGLGTR